MDTRKGPFPAISLGTAIFLLPAIACAHPALGSASGLANGFAHPFTGIDHVLAMIAVGILAANLGGRALWCVPLSFVGLMAAGGALGIAGVKLPGVEIGIALSLVVLGFAIAVRVRWPVAAAAALVGVFAVFHGHAHGTEMIETAPVAWYGIGFVIATSALHLAGITMGLGAAMLRGPMMRAAEAVGGSCIALVGASLLLIAM